MLGCLTRAKFQVRHIFSIKINMGTVQQYGVGEGEVFSILDLLFLRYCTSVYCRSFFRTLRRKSTSKDYLDCHIGEH